MKSYILINGSPEESFQHESLLKNRAFRFGDGLFETIRVYNGIPLFAELHFDRMAEGLSLLKIECDDMKDFKFFENNLNNIVNTNNLKKGGRIRYSVSRLSDGFYKPQACKGISIVEGLNIEDDIYKCNEKGVIIKLYEDILKPINILTPYKNAFPLIHVLAGLNSSEFNCESILINEQNYICEGVSSNIFVLKNNILYTPDLSQGCVRGIMRHVVINILSKLLNVVVVETKMEKDFLIDADEIFFTNVIQGIKWVMGYEKKRYYNAFSKLLSQKLDEYIKSELKIS